MNRLDLTRCIQLSKAEIVRAGESSAECRRLLDHLARISRPRDGAPLLLLLFARLATVACDWLDGDLFIEMESVAPSCTRVTVATAMGSGMREKVFPTFDLMAPLDEFTRAIERIPQMILPLIAEITPERLVLSANEDVRTSAVPGELDVDDARDASGPLSRPSW